MPFTHREPGGQHRVAPLHVADLEQHEDLPPSTNGRQLKPSLAQHSPLQHLTVVLQQKPPQQRCVEEEEQGVELEQRTSRMSGLRSGQSAQ